MNQKAIFHIIFGALIFLARFIPIFHHRGYIIDEWYSIVDYSKACSTILDIVMDNCRLIEITNIAMIVISILFVAYGIFLFFKR